MLIDSTDNTLLRVNSSYLELDIEVLLDLCGPPTAEFPGPLEWIIQWCPGEAMLHRLFVEIRAGRLPQEEKVLSQLLVSVAALSEWWRKGLEAYGLFMTMPSGKGSLPSHSNAVNPAIPPLVSQPLEVFALLFAEDIIIKCKTEPCHKPRLQIPTIQPCAPIPSANMKQAKKVWLCRKPGPRVRWHLCTAYESYLLNIADTFRRQRPLPLLGEIRTSNGLRMLPSYVLPPRGVGRDDHIAVVTLREEEAVLTECHVPDGESCSDAAPFERVRWVTYEDCLCPSPHLDLSLCTCGCLGKKSVTKRARE